LGGKGTNLAERQAEMKRKENIRNAVFQILKIPFTGETFFQTSGKY
jgi:hypothetical protein